MHPPFYVVDHKIDYDSRSFEERRVIRRNRPQSLRFDPPSSRYPFETFAVVPHVVMLDPGPSFRTRFAKWLYRIVSGQPFPTTLSGERA